MGSWKLGQIAGIDVFLHWTLLLLIGVAGLAAPTGYAVSEVAFIAAIFGCVLLHEVGHALAARHFGIGTHDITLLPIGGIASLERIPRRPEQELWIAVAGPLVNVVIASALLVLLGPFQHLLLLPSSPATSAWLTKLMYANVVLVLFNMLPAFPMDGGRVLRALLAFRVPYVVATQQAARVGRYVALALGLFGLYHGLLMLLFAVAFVTFAGAAEARMVALEGREPAPQMTFGQNRVQQYRHVFWDAARRKYFAG